MKEINYSKSQDQVYEQAIEDEGSRQAAKKVIEEFKELDCRLTFAIMSLAMKQEDGLHLAVMINVLVLLGYNKAQVMLAMLVTMGNDDVPQALARVVNRAIFTKALRDYVGQN
jgi:hypothetical protein